MSLPKVELVLGGARSGKTSFALNRASSSGLSKVYVATGTAGDGEMAERIAHHQAERGLDWATIEEPLDLTGALKSNSNPERILLIDCLTLWISNVMFADHDVDHEIDGLTAALKRLDGPVILVSNEVGLGIVPDNAMARRFRDLQGRANQRVADVANRVSFIAAGLPLVLKG